MTNQTQTRPSANPTLSQSLDDRAAANAAKSSDEVNKAYAAGIEKARATGIEKSAKQVGDAAVDAQLSGWDGESVKLSELWQDGPIVLMWYRGGWCPYCNIQLRAMQQSLEKIKSAGAKLVALTPELPEKAKETADANDLDMVALHDKNNMVARKYGIVFQLAEEIIPAYRDKLKLPEFNGTDAMELPLAATYVIDKSGVITYAFLDADYKKRAEPAEIIDAVKAAAK
ncbi:peroxiredoxin-like family protein [Rubripirellula lacrimiformis]|nr:peroxiredoxin-like family protein [Rubripirellula lacrimiformis]